MEDLFLSFNKGGELPHVPIRFKYKFDLKTVESTPRHPKDKSGVVILLGTAACWKEDFEAARAEFPDAPVCGINDAAYLTKVDFISSCHPEKLKQFLKPIDYPIEIHTRKKMDRPAPIKDEYVWDLPTGGGSALFSVAAMIAAGFEMVIMAGCPLNGGGGYGVKLHGSTIDDPRFGDLSPEHTLVRGWQEQVKRFKQESKYGDMVRSMSGFTKKVFGGIK